MQDLFGQKSHIAVEETGGSCIAGCTRWSWLHFYWLEWLNTWCDGWRRIRQNNLTFPLILLKERGWSCPCQRNILTLGHNRSDLHDYTSRWQRVYNRYCSWRSSVEQVNEDSQKTRHAILQRSAFFRQLVHWVQSGISTLRIHLCSSRSPDQTGVSVSLDKHSWDDSVRKLDSTGRFFIGYVESSCWKWRRVRGKWRIGRGNTVPATVIA